MADRRRTVVMVVAGVVIAVGCCAGPCTLMGRQGLERYMEQRDQQQQAAPEAVPAEEVAPEQ